MFSVASAADDDDAAAAAAVTDDHIINRTITLVGTSTLLGSRHPPLSSPLLSPRLYRNPDVSGSGDGGSVGNNDDDDADDDDTMMLMKMFRTIKSGQ